MAKKTQDILASDIAVNDRVAMLGRIYVVVRAEHGYCDYNKRSVTLRPEEIETDVMNVHLMIKDLMPITILKRKK